MADPFPLAPPTPAPPSLFGLGAAPRPSKPRRRRDVWPGRGPGRPARRPRRRARSAAACTAGEKGSGAPPGERNGNYRHGLRTREAIAERRALRALIRDFRGAL